MHDTMARIYQVSGNLSPSELAIAINESPQTITNWTKRGVSKSGALKVAEYFNVDANWILTGKSTNNGIYINGKNTNHGTQIGMQTNYSLSQNITTEQCKETLSAENNMHLKDMPLLDIDDGVLCALNPIAINNLILDSSERVSTFIPHLGCAFGIKVADDLNISPIIINKNDILIIEPSIAPRNNDLVLLCLDYGNTQRGIIAQLKIGLDGTYMIKCDGEDIVPMPNNSLICGVVIEIKRRLIDNALLKSRLNHEWDILSTLVSR